MNTARTVHIGGPLTAAAGILVGVVTAAVVAVAPWRWAPLLGVAVIGYLIIGFILNDTAAVLADPADAAEFVGTAGLAVGLAVAVVAGAMAGIRGLRTQPEVTS